MRRSQLDDTFRSRLTYVWMLALSLGALGIGRTVLAQAPGADNRLPRMELWGAATAITTGPAGILTSNDSPPLLFDGDFTSHGGQVLDARSEFGLGITGGVNVFPSAHVGFQVLLDRASCAVTGSNAPYTTGLEYVSRQPPSGEAQVVRI